VTSFALLQTTSHTLIRNGLPLSNHQPGNCGFRQARARPRRLFLVASSLNEVSRRASSHGVLPTDAGSRGADRRAGAHVDLRAEAARRRGNIDGPASRGEEWEIYPERPYILVGTQDMSLSARALNRWLCDEPIPMACTLWPAQQRLLVGLRRSAS